MTNLEVLAWNRRSLEKWRLWLQRRIVEEARLGGHTLSDVMLLAFFVARRFDLAGLTVDELAKVSARILQGERPTLNRGRIFDKLCRCSRCYESVPLMSHDEKCAWKRFHELNGASYWPWRDGAADNND